MLFSLSLILITGFALSGLFKKFKVPGILAMVIVGVLLGPYVFNLISPDVLDISADLREIALVVILLRAGLSLDLKDLKKVGRPAILMCFVPALFELVTITILAPIIFHISTVEAAIMGAVVAAVSPAVVVPRMLHLMECRYGEKKSIPQLIMAGASVDDVFVIVLFMAFMGMYQGDGFHITTLFKVPVSIILGIALGIISGIILVWVFKKIHMRDTIKVLIIISTSFLFVTIETFSNNYLQISGLIAVMALGGTILKQYEVLAKRLKGKFSKIWVAAEVILFVLVGACVDVRFIPTIGIASILLIFVALISRVLGVNLCLLKTKLNKKERAFCSISYLPKATVQAAIGSIPLVAGVSSGNLILSVAVLAIMITAPLGAFGIDLTYKKLLERNTD